MVLFAVGGCGTTLPTSGTIESASCASADQAPAFPSTVLSAAGEPCNYLGGTTVGSKSSHLWKCGHFSGESYVQWRDGVQTSGSFFFSMANGPPGWAGLDPIVCNWKECLRIGDSKSAWSGGLGYFWERSRAFAGAVVGNVVIVPQKIFLPASQTGSSATRLEAAGLPHDATLTGAAIASVLDSENGSLLYHWPLPPEPAALEAQGKRTGFSLLIARALAGQGGIAAGGRYRDFVKTASMQGPRTCDALGVATIQGEWQWFRTIDETEKDCHYEGQTGQAALNDLLPMPGGSILVLYGHRAPVVSAVTHWKHDLLSIDAVSGATRWRRHVSPEAIGPSTSTIPCLDDPRSGALTALTQGRFALTSALTFGKDQSTLATRVGFFDDWGNLVDSREFLTVGVQAHDPDCMGPSPLLSEECRLTLPIGKEVLLLDVWGNEVGKQESPCATKSYSDCLDTDPCTKDLCDPKLGCIHPPFPDGAFCSAKGTCQAGKCVEGKAP